MGTFFNFLIVLCNLFDFTNNPHVVILSQMMIYLICMLVLVGKLDLYFRIKYGWMDELPLL